MGLLPSCKQGFFLVVSWFLLHISWDTFDARPSLTSEAGLLARLFGKSHKKIVKDTTQMHLELYVRYA